MSDDLIQAPTPIEGEVLTDKLPNNEVEKLAAIIAECEGYFDSILEVSQRIDHGMTDCRPNGPNREIVRLATDALAMLTKTGEAMAAVLGIENDDIANNPLYLGDDWL